MLLFSEGQDRDYFDKMLISELSLPSNTSVPVQPSLPNKPAYT